MCVLLMVLIVYGEDLCELERLCVKIGYPFALYRVIEL